MFNGMKEFTFQRFIPTCVGSMELVVRFTVQEVRFIPTCVGSILIKNSLSSPLIGSSPHAWGRWYGSRAVPISDAVHPHMRGVDIEFRTRSSKGGRFIPTCVGSISDCGVRYPGVCRFIPTCVGSICGRSA